jgi:hypothetical protein
MFTFLKTTLTIFLERESLAWRVVPSFKGRLLQELEGNHDFSFFVFTDSVASFLQFCVPKTKSIFVLQKVWVVNVPRAARGHPLSPTYAQARAAYYIVSSRLLDFPTTS